MVADLFTVSLTGGRRWEVVGARRDPAALSCPVRQIVSTTDRIVPAASAFPCDDRLDLGLGHVGMIVSSSAKERVWRRLAKRLSQPHTSRSEEHTSELQSLMRISYAVFCLKKKKKTRNKKQKTILTQIPHQTKL